ncbi:type II toxin-antitoxin system antitoxin SocA domain-containing protein [Flavobacterium rivuli]|uniref:type II toxin-antitoxin system antitoxin SocA domain-containing protein n=1 Tax=Flavobacterium rivuli TaxID=498301 RepID=UPI00036A2FBA|nr:type II toxin-antitoxin system antitoxin SocA domain-containing protein [Flavobacterium rivuli]
MNKPIKIEAFEYLLFMLVEWHKSENNGIQNNDISILKALKLLFFVSAVGTTRKSESTLLDDVFDNFVAMPYGHVESDIYSAIKDNLLVSSKVDNSKTLIIDGYCIMQIDLNLKLRIDTSVNCLKKINPKLINMNAFDLVELSHAWYSWKYYFAKAKEKFTLREFIPSEIIKAEEKIYFLN